MTELNTGTKSVAEAASQSIQSRATDRSDIGLGGMGGIGGIFHYLFRAGEMISPWWSTQRDIDLRKFVKLSDHLNGSVALLTSKIVNVPPRVEPRDMSLKSHIRQADEYNQRLLEESEFGQGWVTAVSKWYEDHACTDNGGFFEIIGDGKKDGPIKGPALGLAVLDSSRIIRKKNQEFPLAYMDEDGAQYKLHYTRVAYASDQPSPIVEMRGVGFCAVSRAINVAQNLVDISTYKQEKLGSRPPRAVLFTPGIPTDVVQATMNMASEMMDNQALKRYARIPILGGNDTEGRFELIDLASLPDGFDEETSTRLGMFAIALAFGVPIRWIWPAATSGATKADAMYQHIAGLGGGIGRVLKTLSLILGGDPRGPKHSVGKFLPPHLKLVFDFQDDEQDRMKADIRKTRMDTWATALETGATTLRVTREQMLEAGDISQSQFNQMELADGRLPSGEDVMTLFYAAENDLLDLGVDDPLDVERNDREEMIEAIEGKQAEVRKGMSSVGSAKQKEASKQALAALGKLREAYEKVHSAQQQATDAETEEQAEGKDQPDKIEEEEAQEKVETQPPKQVENEEIVEEMNEEARKDSLLTNLYNGLKGLADTIKSRKKVWPPEEEEKGGRGSGNWGHAGRSPHRGGSSPGRLSADDRIRKTIAGIEKLREDLLVDRNVSARMVDAKPGDPTAKTAKRRSVSMVDALEKGHRLPPPRLRLKEDGRYEIVDGNARVEAYRTLGQDFVAIVVEIPEGYKVGEKGGPGSGWFGPPRGTHGSGQVEGSISGKTIKNWVKTKPWDASIDDIATGNVQGIVFDSQARGAFYTGKEIRVGPAFLRDDRDGRRLTLYHEAGHLLAGEAFKPESDFIRVIEPFRQDADKPRTIRSTYDNFVGLNPLPEEFLADIYTSLIHNGASGYEEARYLDVYQSVADIAKKVGLPSEPLFEISEGQWTEIGEEERKSNSRLSTEVWSSLSSVPKHLLSMNGAQLSLSQVNHLARMADAIEASGQETNIAWATARSQFKKLYRREGEEWVRREEGEKGGPGSGHHKHTGRPGQRGGSAPGKGNVAGLEGRVPLSGEIFDTLTDAEVEKTGIAGQGRVLGMLGSAVPGADWQNASVSKRADVKDEVVDTLTRRIAGDPEDVPVPVDPSVESPWNKTYDDVNDFVEQWAHSSNDDDIRSLAIQRDAAAEFGVPLSDFTKSRLEKIEAEIETKKEEIDSAFEREWSEEGIQAKVENAARFQESESFARMAPTLGIDPLRKLSREEHERAIRESKPDSPTYPPELQPLLSSSQQRRILREMYNETQKQLRSRGLEPGSYITLYRGVQLPVATAGGWRVGDNITIEGNVIESWSVDRGVASMFAAGAPSGLQGITFKMAVPIEMILSTCTTGFGCLTEAEVTILGSDGEAQIEWMSMVRGD